MDVVAGLDGLRREPDHLPVSPDGISFGDRSDGELVPGWNQGCRPDHAVVVDELCPCRERGLRDRDLIVLMEYDCDGSQVDRLVRRSCE